MESEAKRTTDEATRAAAQGRMAYTQNVPGCLYLTVAEHRAFVAVLTPEQRRAVLSSSDGMLRATAYWFRAEDEPRIISACCECGTVYGSKPCSPEMDGAVSHGYCAPCAAIVRARMGLKGGRS